MEEQNEFELENQHQFDAEVGDNVMEILVSEYVDRVKLINDEHQSGVEIENQTKISDLLSNGERYEDESFFDYKLRMKAESLIRKHYSRGVRFEPINK